MSMTLSTTLRNARMDSIRTAIDAGSAAGKLRVYDGTRPATGAAITTETLLAEFSFSDPSAPAASGGVLTFSAIATAAAVATGTASWARIVDSDATFIADLDVGTSAAELILNTVSIVSGGNVDVTSATITDGNA